MVERRRLAAAEPVVDEKAQSLAERQHRRGGDDERQDGAGEAPAIRPREGEDPAERAEIARRGGEVGAGLAHDGISSERPSRRRWRASSGWGRFLNAGKTLPHPEERRQARRDGRRLALQSSLRRPPPPPVNNR